MSADIPVLDPPTEPTPGQLRVLAAYLRTGSQKAAAHELGISQRTVKAHMGNLYLRLGVGGILETLTDLGWAAAPSEVPEPCGAIFYCARPNHHRGRHGGMRPFVRLVAADGSRP